MDFFKSDYSWSEILWVQPEGDAYIILAHQYIAASLNVDNGASTTPEVDMALSMAYAWFHVDGYGYLPGIPPSSELGQMFVSNSGTLPITMRASLAPATA